MIQKDIFRPVQGSEDGLTDVQQRLEAIDPAEELCFGCCEDCANAPFVLIEQPLNRSGAIN